jgi:hypothetical protein
MRFSPRWVLIALLIVCTQACRTRDELPTSVVNTASPSVTIPGQRTYEVHQSLELINEGPGQPEKQNIWVALIRDFAPYQEVLSIDVSPADYQLIKDEYGNQYAEFDFSDHPV